MSIAETALRNTKYFPFWFDTAERPNTACRATGIIATDLLIVGAGFTGLWAAILAKEKNPDRGVVIIEASTTAAGASGRPGAILSSSVMHGLGYSKKLFPQEWEQLDRLGVENMSEFRAIIDRYNIDCDVEWAGELVVATGENGLADIKSEHALNIELSKDSTLLGQTEIQKQLNSPLFKGGLWSKDYAGHVNPVKLAWSLRSIAMALGVKLYENTPMVSSKLIEKTVTIQTPMSQISANKVILATNAFTRHQRKVSARVASIRDRIIVTEPLNDKQLSKLGWNNRQGVRDTRTRLTYMRLTSDNRLLFGGRIGYFYNNNTEPNHDLEPDVYIELVERLYKTFPVLSGTPISYAWSGPIALTKRMTAFIQPHYEGRMLYVGGYSGFGVAASRFFARVGLAILDNDEIPERHFRFAQSLPSRLPPEPFRWIGLSLTAYALNSNEKKNGWKSSWLKLVSLLGFPIKF